MRKLLSFLLMISFIIVSLSSCASSKGGGWYKNRNNTFAPKEHQNPLELDGTEEFMSDAEMVLAGDK